MSLPGSAASLGAADLSELLRAFNEVTAKLEGTQETLRSEVRRLQSELEQANTQLRRSRELAALGEMAAGIAHEIRNPLGSISLYAEAIEEDVADLEGPRELAGKIGSAVKGLNRVVGDVLAFSREMRLEVTDCDAEALLTSAADEARHELREAGAELTVSAAGGVSVPCDIDLLRRAVVNLVRNAAEAVRETDGVRRVTVTAEAGSRRDVQGKRAACVVIAVEDSGAGIPEDVLSRMFNPFFTTRAVGTGLGLGIVHRIIDAHGGAVEVGTSSLGGARVALLVPVEADRPLESNHAPQRRENFPEIE